MSEHLRLSGLVALARRNHRLAHLVEAWLSRDADVTLSSKARQVELAEALRTWPATRAQTGQDLATSVARLLEFTLRVELVDLGDGDCAALGVSASAVLRHQPDLSSLYPDGVAIVNDDRALVMRFEFDQTWIETCRRPSKINAPEDMHSPSRGSGPTNRCECHGSEGSAPI